MITKSKSGRIWANFIGIWPIFGPFGLLIENLLLTYENIIAHVQTFIYVFLLVSKSCICDNLGRF